MRIILASASPRRADLLRAAGFTFELRAVDVDERPREGEPPVEYVRRLAEEKADRALAVVCGPEGNASGGEGDLCGDPSDAVVIGADTAVVVDGRILGKPVDAADGERMIRQLSGRAHVVLTGVSVVSSAARASGVDETRVVFAPLSDEQVAWYVDSREGMDKAGGYGIQGLASRFIPRIEGSYSNVVGLPVALVDLLLRQVAGGPRVLASAR